MLEQSSLFHESWYRIADQCISLRASVKVRRQLFRGSRWYVLNDPFNNQFYRLRPEAYGFVSRLTTSRTVESVWKEAIEMDPENAPGQEEVIHLLAQLYHANLLHYDLPPDSTKLFERYNEFKQRATKSALMNIMFFRIPLFDPDALLKRLLPILKIIIGPFGAVIWLVVLGIAVKTAIDNAPALGEQSQGILASTNIALLYLSLILIKALHELGHAFAVRRFGGEVHTMGIMFLIFNPLPYMDATAAWAFRSKWKRVFVGAAGMITELFAAACATFVWANTGPGILHSLAYNMMFIASVSTVLFNINPLLRFDGYYILSDLIDVPNLHTQANQHLRHLVERYAFGYKRSTSPTATLKESYLVTGFGILSGIYRVFVFTSILLFVADRLLIAGIIMAAICVISWVFIPITKLIRYLASNPRLDRHRLRASLVCLTFVAVLVCLLYLIPFRNSFKSPGVLEATEHAFVVNSVPGHVEEILVESGTRVNSGDALFLLSNRELDFEYEEIRASNAEILAMRQRALLESQADLKPLESLLSAIQTQADRVSENRELLTVRAPIKGVWIAPAAKDLVGAWLRRGTPLGQIVNDAEFALVSVVSQKDTSWLFSNEILSSSVKLAGQAYETLPVLDYQVIPAEQVSLPSAALGFGAGGGLAIDVTDRSGLSASEPFYEVRLRVSSDPAVPLLHGRSGRVRFRLPDEPLLAQWYRKLRQLLQDRYQL